jgi:hypothetical protein
VKGSKASPSSRCPRRISEVTEAREQDTRVDEQLDTLTQNDDDLEILSTTSSS